MSLRIFLIHRTFVRILIFMLTGMILSCGPRVIKPSPGPGRMPVTTPAPPTAQKPEPDAAIPGDPEKPQIPSLPEAPKPRLLASLQLTQQARALISDRQPDRAISLLERAVAIDPSNGQNYYYLAEAWLIKEDPGQALNFNELAGIHLGLDTAWAKKISDQRQRIEKLKNTIIN